MSIGYVEIDREKLKAARKAVKPIAPRLKDAADYLDVSPQRLWNWENLYTTMPEDALKKLCKLYKVSRSDIVVSNGASV